VPNQYKALPDALWDKRARARPSTVKFKPTDFAHDPSTNTCICPAGKKLYSTGSHCTTNGRRHHKFQGAKRDCAPCHLRQRCLRHPERTPTRQVAFFEKNQRSPLEFTKRMKAAIDSERGRKLYAARMGTVEPVFANLRHTKRLDRFTLRTRPKGERAVEPVLPGSQHREAGASWLREIARLGAKIAPGDAKPSMRAATMKTRLLIRDRAWRTFEKRVFVQPR
jgi:hypothetical protein